MLHLRDLTQSGEMSLITPNGSGQSGRDPQGARGKPASGTGQRSHDPRRRLGARSEHHRSEVRQERPVIEQLGRDLGIGCAADVEE